MWMGVEVVDVATLEENDAKHTSDDNPWGDKQAHDTITDGLAAPTARPP